MSKIQIYDPAMCCSTGVCGPSVNPELIRVAAVIENLKKIGIEVERHNLSSDPSAFVSNQIISDELNKSGADVLPITLADGKIVKKGSYPTNEELSKWLGVPVGDIAASSVKVKVVKKCNCGSKGCC